ncbi:unnamed protein product [Peniophora sp. CBMAI 1063]|nr:unnamed protein product [Peniophora sp. CBMAI 1063]
MDMSSLKTLANLNLALDNLLSVVFGVYIYELVRPLRFDWNLFAGGDAKRSRLAIGVKGLYIVCRCSILVECIASLVLLKFSIRSTTHCFFVERVVYSTALATIASATLLLSVRVGVIWTWDRRLICAFIPIYLAIIALGVRAVVLIGREHGPDAFGVGCTMLGHEDYNTPPLVAFFVLDVALLILLLIGLRRWSDAGAFSLWRVLWNQGLLYLMIIVSIEAPLTTFLFLSNKAWVSFYLPFTPMLPIGATRLYRSLTQFAGKGSNRPAYESTFTVPQAPRLQALDAPETATKVYIIERSERDEYEMDNERIASPLKRTNEDA